jgi:hypothetical protein
VLFVFSNHLDPLIQRTAETLALSLGLKNYAFSAENEVSRRIRPDNDIVWLGLPRRKDLFEKMPIQVKISEKSFTLNNVVYQDTADAFFGVFSHPFAANRVVALFMPLSSQDADVVAAKITHYGKYSYLAFQSGENREKGIWPVGSSPLIYEWDHGLDN